jgi:hypothetical protein
LLPEQGISEQQQRSCAEKQRSDRPAATTPHRSSARELALLELKTDQLAACSHGWAVQ